MVVYLGMMCGRIPGLALDRAGIALLGTLVLLITGRVSLTEGWQAVDVPTISLLFGLMVVSAQFRIGGFYTRLTRNMSAAAVGPVGLLGLVIATSGLLSALLANDIVCLAMAPVLVEGCVKRGLDPKPYLLALACSANVGSAATLIGNPQNMLIGQSLGLSFVRYLFDAGVPALLGLGVVWLVLVRLFRHNWHRQTTIPQSSWPPYSRWQTGKGMAILSALALGFLFAPQPRELLALGAAALLLTSRRVHSRRILDLVDWQLMVLFIGLFVINHALAASGMTDAVLAGLKARGLDLANPGWLFAVTAALSNLVSNVPATMLLLPAAGHPQAGAILALASTLAGNLLVVGSIANIIVIDQARRLGIAIGWREHARVGVPVTFATLALSAAWLWVRSIMS